MWPRKPRRPSKRAVVAAAEALLEGRALEQGGAARRLNPPPWALVNTLAHAPVERLRAIAETGVLQRPGSFDATLGRLATDVLAVGPGRDEVVAVQRDLLVPVELVLLGHGYLLGVTLSELEMVLRTLLAGRRDPEHPCDC